MTKIEAVQTQEQFAELVRRAGEQQERIVIEHGGQVVAAVISYAELQRFEALEDALDAEYVRRVKATNPEFISLEEVIANYNKLHGTDLTLESFVNE